MSQLIILMLASPYIITSYCRDTSLIIIGFHALCHEILHMWKMAVSAERKITKFNILVCCCQLVPVFCTQAKIVKNYFVVRKTSLN